MDRLAQLVGALALAFAASSASAGYAALSPPPGWSAGGGSTYGSIAGRFGAAAANGGSFWSSSTVINVGGRAITMPVSGTFAANAGRFAARSLALNPLALGVAGAAWLASECIGRKDGSWVLTCGGADAIPSTGLEFNAEALGTWHKTPEEAGRAQAGYLVGALGWANITITTCTVDKPNGRYGCAGTYQRTAGGAVEETQLMVGGAARGSNCPAGWYHTPAGCVAEPPPKTITPQEVEERMAPKTIPPGVFPEIPGVPLPIGPPSINPTPAPNGPSAPLIVPLGDPTPVPNSNPRRWTQPEVEIVPTPTPDSPFRVDIRPQDRPVGDPNNPLTPPKRDPYTPPVNPPVGDPNNPPEPDPLKDPTPKEADLCEKYPDILACMKPKLGELEAQKIKNTEVPLSIEKEGGFPSGGQCPAAKVVPLMGKTFSFTVEPLCDFAKAIKPLLIGFAYLTAALTFLGVARRE